MGAAKAERRDRSKGLGGGFAIARNGLASILPKQEVRLESSKPQRWRGRGPQPTARKPNKWLESPKKEAPRWVAEWRDLIVP